MSSEQINLVATLPVAPGKADRVIELLTNLAKFVEKNEPQTLRYQLLRPHPNEKTGEVEELIMLESFANQAAQHYHLSAPPFLEFSAALQEEKLVSAAPKLTYVTEVSGFAVRK